MRHGTACRGSLLTETETSGATEDAAGGASRLIVVVIGGWPGRDAAVHVSVQELLGRVSVLLKQQLAPPQMFLMSPLSPFERGRERVCV